MALVLKDPPAKAGNIRDVSLIPGSGRTAAPLGDKHSCSCITGQHSS